MGVLMLTSTSTEVSRLTRPRPSILVELQLDETGTRVRSVPLSLQSVLKVSKISPRFSNKDV